MENKHMGWLYVPVEPATGSNYEVGLWPRRNWEAALEDQVAAARAAQAPQGAAVCTGCDPAEGFCRDCREAERKAAHTCTPAPSFATVKDALRRCGADTDNQGRMRFSVEQFSRFVSELGRAAQGAGTAPVLYARQMDLDMLPSTHGVLTFSEPDHSGAGGDWSIPLYRTPPAPVSTAAATTASDGPLINEGTSRAADGQQGESRAALDAWMKEAIRLLGSMRVAMLWPELERHLKKVEEEGAALAQGAAQVEVARDEGGQNG